MSGVPSTGAETGGRYQRFGLPPIDLAVVAEAEAGDPGAVTQLVQLLRPAVRRYCAARARRGVEPDEVATDTLLAVLGALPTTEVRDVDHFTSLVVTVAYRRCADTHRRVMRTEVSLDRVADVATHVSPERATIVREDTQELADRLRLLPATQRQVLIMRAEGVPDAEIAASLGVRPVTITRPNGKPYRPRAVRVDYMDDDGNPFQEYPYKTVVLGTHDVQAALARASTGRVCEYLINPRIDWLRLGYESGQLCWIRDVDRGAACVVFDESDDPPEVSAALRGDQP